MRNAKGATTCGLRVGISQAEKRSVATVSFGIDMVAFCLHSVIDDIDCNDTIYREEDGREFYHCDQQSAGPRPVPGAVQR